MYPTTRDGSGLDDGAQTDGEPSPPLYRGSGCGLGRLENDPIGIGFNGRVALVLRRGSAAVDGSEFSRPF